MELLAHDDGDDFRSLADAFLSFRRIAEIAENIDYAVGPSRRIAIRISRHIPKRNTAHS